MKEILSEKEWKTKWNILDFKRSRNLTNTKKYVKVKIITRNQIKNIHKYCGNENGPIWNCIKRYQRSNAATKAGDKK